MMRMAGDHAQLRTRLRAVRGPAPVGARLLARLGPPPHHRASAGPQAVRPARRFTYAHPLRGRLLPRSFVPVPFSKFTVNLGRPFPPVRGWILQQVLKLAAVAASEDDVVLLVDSDIEFVRPFTAETFVRDGVVRFYSKPDEIDERLPRHMIWHRVARALLGLPPAEPPYTDYISSLLAWDPAIVRRMLARVTATTGRPWTTAIAGQLHFSEWTLYGVFVDDVIGAPANSFASDDPLCLAYWDETPLDRDGAVDFLRGVRPTDVAAMISAKSRTPLAVRRAAFADHRAARTAGHR